MFVSKTHHEYSHVCIIILKLFVVKKQRHVLGFALQEIFEKEEAGTPNIVGSIRLGLVFQLKNNIGTSLVVARENYFTRLVDEHVTTRHLNFLTLYNASLQESFGGMEDDTRNKNIGIHIHAKNSHNFNAY